MSARYIVRLLAPSVAVDGIYGKHYFPRYFAYKTDADKLAQAVKKLKAKVTVEPYTRPGKGA